MSFLICPYMPYMVQKSPYMSFLICPICLIWFKKVLICPFFYVLIGLIWFKKVLICPFFSYIYPQISQHDRNNQFSQVISTARKVILE